MKIKNNNNENITYERLTLSNKSYLGTSEQWGIYFSNAMEEIVRTKMHINSYRLIFLLLSHLANKEYAMGDNSIRLLRGIDYADLLGVHQPKIPVAFKELEELGFIMRDKETRSISVTINPAIAYRGKFKDYKSCFNQLALPFGNTPIAERKNKGLEQDWDSNVTLND